MTNKYIIFDLDDTLVYEIDYLKSAYLEISKILDPTNVEYLCQEMIDKYYKALNVFDFLIEKYESTSREELLYIYRYHFPNIELVEGAKELLQFCKNSGYRLGLITDGRSITQRNKLKALGIDGLFDKIIVSEEFGSTKPDEKNFRVFMSKEVSEYYYIADNPKKDFLTPNRLGWKTICLLDKGKNIHDQDFNVSEEYLPKIKIKFLNEVLGII